MKGTWVMSLLWHDGHPLPTWRADGTAGPGLWCGSPVLVRAAGGCVQQGDPCFPWLLLLSLARKEQTQHFIRATNPNKTLSSKEQWFYHQITEQETELVCVWFFESWWWRVVPKQGSLGPWLLVSSRSCQVQEKKKNQKYVLSSQEKSEPTPNI